MRDGNVGKGGTKSQKIPDKSYKSEEANPRQIIQIRVGFGERPILTLCIPWKCPQQQQSSRKKYKYLKTFIKILSNTVKLILTQSHDNGHCQCLMDVTSLCTQNYKHSLSFKFHCLGEP